MLVGAWVTTVVSKFNGTATLPELLYHRVTYATWIPASPRESVLYRYWFCYGGIRKVQ